MGASHRRRVPRARSRAVRRCTARLVAVTATLLVVVAATFAVPVARASAADGTGWEPPVPGGVQRGFVEPASDYETGHRGVDFAAAPGTPVRAAGGGTVTFAGDVAGALHVVVLHRNALRTSYSFLLDVTVTTGDRVDAGTVI